MGLTLTLCPFQALRPAVRPAGDRAARGRALVLLAGVAVGLLLGKLQLPVLRHPQHRLLRQQRRPHVGQPTVRQVSITTSFLFYLFLNFVLSKTVLSWHLVIDTIALSRSDDDRISPLLNSNVAHRSSP